MTLVEQRVGDPGDVDDREEARSQQGVARLDGHSEERMERHGGEEHDQPQGRCPLARPGVDANEDHGEQIAGQQEVDDHQDVAGVGRQGQLEQRRVVEDDEPEHKVDPGDNRIGPEGNVFRVHQAENDPRGP